MKRNKVINIAFILTILMLVLIPRSVDARTCDYTGAIYYEQQMGGNCDVMNDTAREDCMRTWSNNYSSYYSSCATSLCNYDKNTPAYTQCMEAKDVYELLEARSFYSTYQMLIDRYDTNHEDDYADDDDTTNNNPGNSMIGNDNYNPTLPGGEVNKNDGNGYSPTFSYENSELFEEGASPCSNADIAMAVSVIGKVISIIQIVVPILLVIIAIVDLLKAVVSQDDNNTSKTMAKLIKRIISAVIIFFIIAIVRLVCNIAGKDVDASCMNILGDPWSYEMPKEEE